MLLLIYRQSLNLKTRFLYPGKDASEKKKIVKVIPNYLISLTRPVSITYVTSGMVIDVSAMLVDATTCISPSKNHCE